MPSKVSLMPTKRDVKYTTITSKSVIIFVKTKMHMRNCIKRMFSFPSEYVKGTGK